MKPISSRVVLFVGLGARSWRWGLRAGSALLASAPLPGGLFSCDLPVLRSQGVIPFPGSFLPKRVALVRFAAEKEESNTPEQLLTLV